MCTSRSSINEVYVSMQGFPELIQRAGFSGDVCSIGKKDLALSAILIAILYCPSVVSLSLLSDN